MGSKSRPRKGSLQFYPRKRSAKVLPSVNWKPFSSESKQGVLGFIAYKAAMATAIIKDSGEKSMTKNKQIAVPVTILEVPNMKIYSVRFYKNRSVMHEIIVSNEKELKRKLKSPKEVKKLESIPNGCDDIRIIAYSLPKQTSIKKTPDVIELAIGAQGVQAKFELVKSLIGKEISLENFTKSELVDVHGLTKGKGTQGPTKRFGLTLKFHKSEKGVRRPGSLGPWHPARVTFMAPMAGQLGLFSRTVYNLRILNSGAIIENDINPGHGFKNYGKIKSSFLIIKGSVPGPAKRQLLLTAPLRPSKEQTKKKYEFLELVTK
jgi:large subunit ribosomal protein L3